MAEIRSYRAQDLEALYEICRLTGDFGQDATPIYRNSLLLGHLFAAPYGVLEPRSCFVVEDELGVGGYIVGTSDTHGFEERLEKQWWPSLRTRIDDPWPARRGMIPDERLAFAIHHPVLTPVEIHSSYPAHLHINCLPRLQGKGIGKRLMDRWLGAMAKAGVGHAHLGVGPRNLRGVQFYEKYGFHLVKQQPPPFNTLIFGIATSA